MLIRETLTAVSDLTGTSAAERHLAYIAQISTETVRRQWATSLALSHTAIRLSMLPYKLAWEQSAKVYGYFSPSVAREELTEYDSLLTDVDPIILANNSIAEMRHPREEDEEAIREFYHSLDPRSRRLRFLGTVSESSAETYGVKSSSLVTEDARDVIVVIDEGGQSRVIAHGTYLPLSSEQPEVVDIAFAVSPDHQGEGIGTTVMRRLISTFVADPDAQMVHTEILPENKSSQFILAAVADEHDCEHHTRFDYDYGVTTFEIQKSA